MTSKINSLICAGILTFKGLTYSQEAAEVPPLNPFYTEKELITKEQPARLVSDAIDKKQVQKKDVVNFISRIDEEKIDSKSKYANGPFLENWSVALEDEINEDPLFYAGGYYDSNDIIVKNQMINASWSVLVGRYPEVFGRVEKTTVYVKRITTLESPQVGNYRVKINPELDEDNYPRIKCKIKSEKDNFLGGTYLKFGKEGAQIGKTWDLAEMAKKAALDFDLEYRHRGEVCGKLTLKMPFWFGKDKERAKINSVAMDNLEILVK